MEIPVATDRAFQPGDQHEIDIDQGSRGRSNRSGWLVMRDCMLDRTIDHPPACIKFGMVHPEIGIALIDLAPDQTPDAVARLRRKLFSGVFPKGFPSQLPIVYRALPKNQLPQLGAILDYAFAVEPQIPPAHGTAWVEAVCWALATEPTPIRPAAARDSTAPRPVSRLTATTTATPRRRSAARPVIRSMCRRTPQWHFIAGGGLLLGLLAASALLPPVEPPPPVPGSRPEAADGSRLEVVASDRDAPSRGIPPGLAAARTDPEALHQAPAADPPALPPAPMAFAFMVPSTGAPAPDVPPSRSAETTTGEAQRGALVADRQLVRPTATVGPPDSAEHRVAAPGRRILTPNVVEFLFRRGDQAQERGDFSAARLLYARAAEAGHAGAALAAGRAFDPGFLEALKATGLRGEPAVAAAWYRHAGALGAPEAAGLLQQLEERAVPAPLQPPSRRG